MEVLTNNEQRQKYDSHRQGRYGYPRASGVKGNPYADLSKNFPPPPRPPGFPQRPPMQKRQPTASTADKYAEYASYTKDAPSASASRRAGKADATWKAWEGMRPQNKATGQAAASGASSRNTSSSRSASAAKPPPVPPRAPPPQKQPEGAFGNSTRASRGYVPQSPSGDEPPVSNNNYFTTRIHSNVFPATSATARNRRRAPSGTGPDVESSDSTSPDPRLSTPYQTQGGEKFDPWDDTNNLGRSRSTRESNRQSYHGESGANTAGTRHRSASNPDEPDRSPQSAQNVNGRPNNREDAGATRNNDGDFGFAGDNKGKGTSDLYAQRFLFTRTRDYEVPQRAQYSTSRAGEAEFYSKKTLNLPPELQELLEKEYKKSLSKDKHRRADQDGLNAFELNLQDTITKLSAQKYGPGIQSGSNGANTRYFADPQQVTQKNSTANNKTSNSNFDTQFSSDQPHRFSRNSTENINTRFVAEDEATNWQFNAGSPVGESGRPAMPRSKSGGRVGRSPPTTSPQTQQKYFPEPASGGISPKNASFNPEEWSEKIGPQIFEAPAVHRTSTSTSRSGRNTSRKPKPVRMTAGTAGMVDSDESSSGQEDPAKKSTASVDTAGVEGAASPNAMDIDPPAVSTGANGVRNIPVTPSRPEWRAGDVGGIKVDSAPEVPPRPAFVPPVAGSEDSEEFQAKLSDLRNVEPLAGRATGLDSFVDLKSNLPFPSAASGHVPTRKPVSKAHDLHLNLPLPPTAPNPPPALAVPGLKPSAVAWKKYADEFTAYVAEWHAYNVKYADHFKARMTEVKLKMSNPSWLQSKDGNGIHEYMLWVEQDREVRARWTEVSDEHEMNVRLFAAHSEKMMK